LTASKEAVSSNESDSKRFSIEEAKSSVSIASEDGWKMDEDLDKESREGEKSKKVKDEEIHGCLERNHHAPLPQRESIESHLQQPDCAQKGFQIGDH